MNTYLAAPATQVGATDMAPRFEFPEQNAMAALIEDQGASVAAVTSLGTCMYCGEVVFWTVTRNGKRAPYDVEPDDKGKPVVHFATCANKKRKPR
jgi:hypothetical protein